MGNRRFQILSRAACIRLAILLAAVVFVTGWFWFAMIRMPLSSYDGPWVPLDAAEEALRQGLQRDVEVLAGEIGDRNVFIPEKLRAAAGYIENALREAGYPVRRYDYLVAGETCSNLEAELPGRGSPQEIIVVGAHYDSAHGSPAANDNASGVAALLALAERMAQAQPERTVRFVAFANEEPPFFQTPEMGSWVYARICRERGDNIIAMLSLETIGFYTEEPNSQQYPFPLSLFYPSRGNFVAFVGNARSGDLVRRSIAVFRRTTSFPSEGAALPGVLPGIGWSDHWAFWQEGFPALMITDTALFRYPHYHTAEDTPDRLDYERMARVVAGIEEVVRELSAAPESRP
jgi:Zn-dependent M28 family amino/carboxypeptidase